MLDAKGQHRIEKGAESEWGLGKIATTICPLRKVEEWVAKRSRRFKRPNENHSTCTRVTPPQKPPTKTYKYVFQSK